MDGENRRKLRGEKLLWSRNPYKDTQEMVRLDKLTMAKLKNGYRQKNISTHAIEVYLGQDFEFISAIPGDNAIVRFV